MNIHLEQLTNEKNDQNFFFFSLNIAWHTSNPVVNHSELQQQQQKSSFVVSLFLSIFFRLLISREKKRESEKKTFSLFLTIASRLSFRFAWSLSSIVCLQVEVVGVFVYASCRNWNKPHSLALILIIIPCVTHALFFLPVPTTTFECATPASSSDQATINIYTHTYINMYATKRRRRNTKK